MGSDPFARLRKVDTGVSASFPEHLEHLPTVPVFHVSHCLETKEHPEHPEHRRNVEHPADGAEIHAQLIDPTICDGGYDLIPAQWRDGMRRLNSTPCPTWLEGDWWHRFVRDAFRFMMRSGADAIDAGWTIGNLFGVDADATLISLVPDLRGDRVVAFEHDRSGNAVAMIRTADGHRVHWRQMPDRSRLLWKVDPRSLAHEEG